VRTASGALIVDALNRLDDGRELLEALNVEAGRARALVYTHHHLDHVIGGSVFPPVEVVSSERTATAVARYAERVRFLLEVDDAGLDQAAREQKAQIQGWDLKRPTFVFEGRITLYWDPQIRITHLGGHTEGSTVVHIPSEGVLFTGDLVFNNSPAWVGDADLAVWRAALDTMEGWRAEVVVPGHGPVGGPEMLARQRTWLISFGERMEELRRTGKTAREARDILVDEFEYTEANGYTTQIIEYFAVALSERFGFPQ
jgi:cyclase